MLLNSPFLRERRLRAFENSFIFDGYINKIVFISKHKLWRKPL